MLAHWSYVFLALTHRYVINCDPTVDREVGNCFTTTVVSVVYWISLLIFLLHVQVFLHLIIACLVTALYTFSHYSCILVFWLILFHTTLNTVYMILSYLSCQNSVHKIGVYSYSLLTTAPIRTNIQNMLNSSILTRRVASWSGCVPAITGTARLTQSSASGLTRGAVGNRTSTGRCKNWNRPELSPECHVYMYII